MPLQIIRQDITKMKTDAIVNPSNTFLFPSGGTDLKIHKAAGEQLSAACKSLGGCAVGEARITSGFNLSCKHVIHTAGPVWGKDTNPERLLASCYKSCLELARENLCESIAFPLISSGSHGYPKDQVLKIAIDTISTFLFENEMSVYLVVFDKQAYELSEKLFGGIEAYIDDNYVTDRWGRGCSDEYTSASRPVYEDSYTDRRTDVLLNCLCEPQSYNSNCIFRKDRRPEKKKSLEDFIKLDESFAVKLLKLIDEKGMSDVECYKKANVSKQTWHKLMTDKEYRPGKKTAISFSIALGLTLDETQKLLASVGYILSDSCLFDVIIKYCLENGIYDVFEIDAALFKYDQETLFSKA